MHADHTGQEFVSDLEHARQMLRACDEELEANCSDLAVIVTQLRCVPTVSGEDISPHTRITGPLISLPPKPGAPLRPPLGTAADPPAAV